MCEAGAVEERPWGCPRVGSMAPTLSWKAMLLGARMEPQAGRARGRPLGFACCPPSHHGGKPSRWTSEKSAQAAPFLWMVHGGGEGT